MDNYEAIAYAITAVETLKKDGKEITPSTLHGRILHLMDLYSETEIYKLYVKEYT